MILNGGLPVGLLEIILRGALGDAEDLVVLAVVALLRRPPKHVSASKGIDREFRIEKRGGIGQGLRDPP